MKFIGKPCHFPMNFIIPNKFANMLYANSIVVCVLPATVEEGLATCDGKLSGATVVRLHGASCKSFPGTFQIWLKGKLFRQNSDRAIKSDSHEGSSSFRSHYRVIYGNGNSLAWLLAPLKCDSAP